MELDTPELVEKCITRIRGAFARHGRVSVTVRAGKRSNDQNAVQHVWYLQVATALGEHPRDVRRYCKLHFGVPILRGDDHFRAFYDKAIKHHLTYPEKLEAMDYLPVTRLMDPPQMTTYLRHMREHYADHHGIELRFLDEIVPPEDPDERLA